MVSPICRSFLGLLFVALCAPAAIAQTTPFLAQSGQVVMEVENAHGNVARGGKTWTPQTGPSGLVGSAVQALPNTGTIVDTGYTTTTAELQFQVQFAAAGTYQVWLRGYAANTNDNAAHVGVNGQAVATADRLSLPTFRAWTWFKSTSDGPVATVTIAGAGVHTINVWMREDGLYLDRVLLTTNASFTPTGTGPAESPHTGGGPTNQAPVVTAGADQNVTLPNGVTLSGSATDDGLPAPPAALTYAWSQVSGPGTTTFGTPAAAITTASFSAAGVYTLRLTATDSALSGTDDVVVTVTAGATNQPPVVSAGADQTVALATGATLNGSATDDGLPSPPAALTYAWSQVSGPGMTTFGTPAAATTTASFSAAGAYVLRLTASDSVASSFDNVAVTVTGGASTAVYRINVAGAAFTDSQGRAWSADMNFAGTTGTFAVSQPIAGTMDDALYQKERYGSAFSYALPVANATYTVVLHFAEIWFNSAGARVFDVSAEGSVVVDNLDIWAQAGQFSALMRTVSVPVTDGVLNLAFTSVVDNAKIAAIEVLTSGGGPTNQAPVVTAGPDQTTALPNGVTLTGSASDDGLPAPPATLTYSWSQVSGPATGTTTFGTPAAASTTASFSVAGVYTLRLTVSDSALSGTDDVVVTVTGGGTGVTCVTSPNPTVMNFGAAVAGTYGNSGFSCFIPGTVTPTGANLAVSGGSLAVTSTAGDFYQTVNTQNNALGVRLANTGSYAVRVRIKGPFTASVPYQSAGVYLALNTDNYAKLALGQGASGLRLEFGVETAASFGAVAPDPAFNISSLDAASEAVDLWLVRKANGTIEALYRTVTNLTGSPVLGTIVSLGTTPTAPAWTGSSELYGGLTTTHFGSTTAMTTAFDEFELGAPVTPGGGPTNQAPTVTAGADQTITLPNGATLTGSATDDGLPAPPAMLTYAWSQVSGPGTSTAAFGSATAATTTANFPAAGVYTLRLTVSDGALSAIDDVVVTVNGGPAVTCGVSANPTVLNFSGAVAGTYGSNGFACFLPGSVPPTGANLALNGFASHLVVTSTAGDLYQTVNSQENALGVRLANTGSYAVRVRIKGPFAASTPYQSAGVYLALNADNYAKLSVGHGGNGLRLEFGLETSASFAPVVPDTPFNISNLDAASEGLDLWLVRKSNGTIEAMYRTITNLAGSPVFGSIASLGSTPTAPGWSTSGELYGGLTTTHFATSTAFDTFFDEFEFGPPVTAGAGSSINFTKKVIIKEGGTVGSAFGIPGFDNPTSLAGGPDGRLYVATQDSHIYIVKLDPQSLDLPNAASVTHVQRLDQIFNVPTRTCNIGNDPNNCQYVSGSAIGRQITGLAIGPESVVTGPSPQIVLYVTHSDPRIGDNNSAVALSIDTWSGMLTRIRLQPGVNDYTVVGTEDLVVGLPRSRENHGPNAIAFGPDNWVYFTLAGNTNFGQPSTFFSMLPETSLSASVMRLNRNLTGQSLPFNVQGITKAQLQQQYTNVLELFATGFRNAYDLVWHSNGQLYLNANAGNGGLGNTPDSSDGCPTTQSINPGTLPDTLNRVVNGDYGGHPNPARGECVLMNGAFYTPPQNPPANFRPALLSYNQGASTNGIAEYTSNAFNGQLKGNLISATYAGNQNIRRIILNAAGTGVLAEINLGSFNQPLDLATDAAGRIYVAEHGGDQITLLLPNEAAAACPNPSSPDDDGDGFSDSDETANGTDPCNPASLPLDFDGDFIGDRSDGDIDGDGSSNALDQLPYDQQNGATTDLPLAFDWNPGDTPLGGVANTGFRGAQISSSGPRLNETLISVGAAGGYMSVVTTAGTAQGASNSQVNALQVGFDSTEPFRIWSRIVEPFNSVTPAPGHVGAVFFGPGQNDFVRLGIIGRASGQQSVQFGYELGGAFTEIGQASLGTAAVTSLDLHLTADPVARTLSGAYELNGSGIIVELGTALNVPASWFSNNQGGAGGTSLAGIMTSHGSATQTVFVYDFFRIDENAAFGPYQESSGQVVMEAESFDGLVGRGRKSWKVRKEEPGFAGKGAMALLPDTGAVWDLSFALQTPELQYRVHFDAPGTYRVWIRGFADKSDDASMHVGLDGRPQGTANGMVLPGLGNWLWSNSTLGGGMATIVVPTAGDHIINLWPREDGIQVDKLILTTNPVLAPAGTGPAKSPRARVR